jgi:putative ABC transport system substrate-binding protein
MLFDELLRVPVDVLVAVGQACMEAALAKTRSVPIVSVGMGEPVGQGLAVSTRRPAPNVTGITEDAGADLAGKRLALLKQIAPRTSRIAYLTSRLAPADYPGPAARDAASALGVTLLTSRVETVDRLEAAIDSAVTQGANGLFLDDWPPFSLPEVVKRINRAAASHRLPTFHFYLTGVLNGGLVSYAADRSAMYGRAAHFVHKILNGTKAAEIPVEQPSRYVLAINARTARALGLQIPLSMLSSADRVIDQDN